MIGDEGDVGVKRSFSHIPPIPNHPHFTVDRLGTKVLWDRSEA